MSAAFEDHLTHFQARVLREAWREAWAETWHRRARALEDAAPRAGDHPGQATEAELDEAARRCTAAATACRNRAADLDDAADQALLDTATAWSRGAA